MHAIRTNKVGELLALIAQCVAYRRAGRSVVWTNGCFDLIHAGHIRSLEAASRLGDVLVVGLNSDDSVRRLKGEGRPILPAGERAAVLAALECVDHVLVFDQLTPTAVLEQLQPEVHCKGAEYAPPHGRPLPERAVVESYGGRVAFLPLLEGLSTTELIQRIARLARPP
jgi:rfaE bifunctional protein nucleotidyltransferase chain/domain